jgi:adenylate cyclase
VFVITYTEEGSPRRAVLPLGETVAGRSPSCDIVVDDVSVSRRHAKFAVKADHCSLIDLSSRNGTYVNGALVTDAVLVDGDRVVLGRVPLSVEYSLGDRLQLSEHHTVIEDPGTIYKQVSDVSSSGEREGAAMAGRSLRLLSEIARTLVTNRPPADVFAQVVQLAFETCPAERAFLVLRDEATGNLVPRVASRRDGTDIRAVSLSRTIVNRVMTERVAVLATDAQVDSRTATAESVRAQPVRSFMCAPLWHGERDVIGVVYVDASLTQRFSATDLDLLTALANFAAVAIEQARRRERLQRYHSAAVVNRIFEAGADIDTPFFAQERDVSVLFADIAGFTALSETLTPAQTAVLLNGFFERMADAVFEHEGTLDKFIGDAVMTVFGAPLDQPDHAIRAVKTAHSMQKALARLNAESSSVPLQIRIGIHSGLARAGDIGSVRRREYTVLGDVVNTASRLESAVARPGQIIISRATRERLDDSFMVTPLGPVTLRGRHEPVEVFDATLPDAVSTPAQ